MNEEKSLDLPLTKQGNSLAVVIPKKVLMALALSKGDFVKVTLQNKNAE